MRQCKILTVLVIAVISGVLLFSDAMYGQKRKRGSKRRGPSNSHREAQHKTPAPMACYKLGAAIDDLPLEFVTTGEQWPQPNGDGSALASSARTAARATI